MGQILKCIIFATYSLKGRDRICKTSCEEPHRRQQSWIAS
jgi:hypothetical protein